ncbi:MAG: HD domain-containing protein [Oscillospiraceae bacterium]|jgi:3'-5' exoribonuclease|nr:HD domain-containing protein [Oscillospiraceae bacterium]
MHFITANATTGAVEGYCIAKTVEQKTTAKGQLYLDLSLIDAEGEIGAKFWDYRPETHSNITSGAIVKVRGVLQVYNGQDQFRVERIRLVNDKDTVPMEELVPCAPIPAANMLAEIRGAAERFEDEHLRALVLDILNENEERLLYWPAAFRLHHAVRGGLLWHTLSVLRLAQAVAGLYKNLNADLLFAGAILHDIEKCSEFEVPATGLASGYTRRGNLMGHLVSGAVYLEQKGKQLHTPEETLLLLQHMLISHHGEPEFGAAVRPLFLEAEVLSQLDLLDARINEVDAALAVAAPGAFTNKIWAMENRKFYRPTFS